jgi:NAD-dependent deacetylase
MDAFGLPEPLAVALHASLKSAETIVVFTGAGASAESGLATFRDAQVGLWRRFNPEDLATPRAFRKNPALVWGWCEWRRAQVSLAEPNAGHLAIAHWAHSREVTVVTQNVDDLHERAGSRRVVHLHGSIFRARCFDCGAPYDLPSASASTHLGGEPIDPPRCSHCGGMIRPGVVWFEEAMPEKEWREAEELCKRADVLICVGTSALVYPAAHLPQLAARRGAAIIQVNPNSTEHDSLAEFVIRGTAGDIMPRIAKIGMEP